MAAAHGVAWLEGLERYPGHSVGNAQEPTTIWDWDMTGFIKMEKKKKLEDGSEGEKNWGEHEKKNRLR